MKKERKIFSPSKRKFLWLLETGVRLSFTRSLGKQKQIIKKAAREWRAIERRILYRHLDEFYHARLINYQEKADGTIDVVLTDRGHKRALSFNIDLLELKVTKRWDERWRLLIYDIPHHRRAARDALQRKLRSLGFIEWQKSVLVYPFDCRDEVDFVVEFFELRPYVRYAELINPTNESELKLKFNLK